MANIDGYEITTERDKLLAAMSGTIPLSDVETPVTPRDKLLYRIAEDRAAMKDGQDDLAERLKALEENPSGTPGDSQVTAAEIESWNAKVRCYLSEDDGETLIFTNN